jgi:Holliday junction resolvase RusA-like endonuclease
LEDNTFTTQTVGEYSFYAIYDDVKSNNVTVCFVATEEPAKKEYVLSVAPSTIVADGAEKATFSLKADGSNVANFEVYNAADNSKLASKEFSTTTAGTYSFYAICEGEKSNTVEVKATEVVVEQPKPVETPKEKKIEIEDHVGVTEHIAIKTNESNSADVDNLLNDISDDSDDIVEDDDQIVDEESTEEADDTFVEPDTVICPNCGIPKRKTTSDPVAIK